METLTNYYLLPDYNGWQKFNGGIVPDGYEVRRNYQEQLDKR